MKKILLSIIVMLAVVLFSNSTKSLDATENITSGLQEIINLYETRDFDKLIRTRYAEIYKAESEEQILVLIGQFKTRYSNEDMLNRVIDLYKSLLDKTPEFSDDNKTATFNLDNGFVKFSLMSDGRWGFHL